MASAKSVLEVLLDFHCDKGRARLTKISTGPLENGSGGSDRDTEELKLLTDLLEDYERLIHRRSTAT